jgi:hypothetical protein
MGRQTKTKRRSAILPSSPTFEEDYLDVDGWPHRWRVEPRDLAPGEHILATLKPFLVHLLNEQLAHKTLRVHRDHLCTLGGEIIRRLHEDPPSRRRPIQRVLAESLDEDGGPLMYPLITETEQRSFDSTCRKLHRFLQQSRPRPSK